MSARQAHVRPTIRQLKSKRYQAQYTDMAGNRVPAPHTFMYKVDAEAYLADRRREIEISRYNPSVVKRPKVLFADYANDWLEHRHVNGKPIKPRTREHYRKILDTCLIPRVRDEGARVDHHAGGQRLVRTPSTGTTDDAIPRLFAHAHDHGQR